MKKPTKPRFLSKEIEADFGKWKLLNAGLFDEFGKKDEDAKARLYEDALYWRDHYEKMVIDLSEENEKLRRGLKDFPAQVIAAREKEHRTKTSHRIRGKKGGDRGKKKKADAIAKIKLAEKKLASTTKPRQLNKAIAKETGLSVDDVRKKRRWLRKQSQITTITD